MWGGEFHGMQTHILICSRESFTLVSKDGWISVEERWVASWEKHWSHECTAHELRPFSSFEVLTVWASGSAHDPVRAETTSWAGGSTLFYSHLNAQQEENIKKIFLITHISHLTILFLKKVWSQQWQPG